MYLNAFNNDLIPLKGFLSRNNLPAVVCCRWLENRPLKHNNIISIFPSSWAPCDSNS